MQDPELERIALAALCAAARDALPALRSGGAGGIGNASSDAGMSAAGNGLEGDSAGGPAAGGTLALSAAQVRFEGNITLDRIRKQNLEPCIALNLPQT